MTKKNTDGLLIIPVNLPLMIEAVAKEWGVDIKNGSEK